MKTPEKMKEAVEATKKGKPASLTVRQLLRWYGWERREKWVVHVIRRDLERNGVRTTPDFESAYIDGSIELRTIEKPLAKTESGKQDSEAQGTVAEGKSQASAISVDPAHRISRLKAANTKPTSVNPNDSIEVAVTLMLMHDYSQLPIMTSEREVKGIVSWRSLGRKLALGKECNSVQQCAEPAHEVLSTASMFDVMRIIAQHDAVLIRDENKIITGIVTAADVNDQFRLLAEPFLLLGDIETALRGFIELHFSAKEIQAATDPSDGERKAETANDLTFGEYLRLLQNQAHWEKIKLKMDRKSFTEELDKIRCIRNDVMHFDPDGIDETALEALRKFAKFMDQLQSLS